MRRNHESKITTTAATISADLAKETGICDASAKVNEAEHIHGSPFVVQVNARPFRSVSSFEKQGSAAGMLSWPWRVAVNERNEIAVTDRHATTEYSCSVVMGLS